MPNIQSAKKRERQTITRRLRNMSLRSRARTFMKRVLSEVKNKNHSEAMRVFNQMQSVLDKATKVGIFKANKVARHKSRINARIKALKN